MGEKVSVRQLQRAFSHSILYKNKGVFPWIEGTDEREVLARLQVYHNNVYSSLRDALAEVYTPIAHALGEEKFKRLTEEFVQESPPVSGCIYAYGKGFDAFLKANSLSTQFPWACQAALLCWRTSQALSMEDTTPASTEALSQILPEHWGDLCFSFPKAFFLEKVSWNLEPLWEAVQNEASVDFDSISISISPSYALISRPRLKTTLQWINQDLHIFLQALHEGESLSAALNKAQRIDSDFNLAKAIQFLLFQELVVDFSRRNKS